MTPQSEPISAHKMDMRVYYEDTDAGGVVYYPNYLKFAERGRTEMLREAGTDHQSLKRDHGVGFVVRRCEVDYLRSAVLDDLLTVVTEVVSVRAASVDMVQTIFRRNSATGLDQKSEDAAQAGVENGTELVKMLIRIAMVNAAGRPVRMPGPVREGLQEWLTGSGVRDATT